jgi:hypothetical protein
MTPQDVRDMLHFVEGRLNGAKEMLNWLADMMAKDEKAKASEAKPEEPK